MNLIQKFNAFLDERIYTASGFNSESAYLIAKIQFNKLFNVTNMQQDKELIELFGSKITADRSTYPMLKALGVVDKEVLSDETEDNKPERLLFAQIDHDYFHSALLSQLWFHRKFVEPDKSMNDSEFMVQVARLPAIAISLDRMIDKVPAMQCRGLYADLQDFQYIHVTK